MRDGLRKLSHKHSCLGSPRGLGLMTAIDVLSDGPHHEYSPALRDKVIQSAFHRGLLLLGCGESALRFCPPLCITALEVETCLRILDLVLTDVQAPMLALAEAG